MNNQSLHRIPGRRQPILLWRSLQSSASPPCSAINESQYRDKLRGKKNKTNAKQTQQQADKNKTTSNKQNQRTVPCDPTLIIVSDSSWTFAWMSKWLPSCVSMRAMTSIIYRVRKERFQDTFRKESYRRAQNKAGSNKQTKKNSAHKTITPRLTSLASLSEFPVFLNMASAWGWL
jgi:hypothetical protein